MYVVYRVQIVITEYKQNKSFREVPSRQRAAHRLTPDADPRTLRPPNRTDTVTDDRGSDESTVTDDRAQRRDADAGWRVSSVGCLSVSRRHRSHAVAERRHRRTNVTLLHASSLRSQKRHNGTRDSLHTSHFAPRRLYTQFTPRSTQCSCTFNTRSAWRPRALINPYHHPPVSN